MEWIANKTIRKPIVKNHKKVNFEKGQPELLQGSKFDIVEKLRKQTVEITVPQLLQMSNDQTKRLKASLKRPKEIAIRFTDQDEIKTTTLECEIVVNGFQVPVTIDSGAAASIISRNAMEQLGFDIEEATSKSIVSANGGKQHH